MAAPGPSRTRQDLTTAWWAICAVRAVREPPVQRPAMSWGKRGDRHRRSRDRFQGTAPPCPYATRKCPWFGRCYILPARNVEATRRVALGAHAGQRRRVTWDHRARSHQGDAPRRPYMPCVHPRALHQRTSQHTRPTRYRGRFANRPCNAHGGSAGREAADRRRPLPDTSKNELQEACGKP